MHTRSLQVVIPIALALSALQFRFFDCNEVRVISYLAGVLAIVCLWLTVDFARARRILASALCLAATFGAGMVGLVSHMCG